jgi:hypothetical protein
VRYPRKEQEQEQEQEQEEKEEGAVQGAPGCRASFNVQAAACRLMNVEAAAASRSRKLWEGKRVLLTCC